MKINDTNQFIKDNLQNILDGKFDDKFSQEQLKMMLEMSFLYNHISFEPDAIIFKYNGVIFKVSGINNMIQSSPYPPSEDEILSTIRNDSVFKSAYASFLRDKKIDDILK